MVYLINHSPATAIDCTTPNEVWSRTLAHYFNLRIFGCHAYCHVSKGKLNASAKKGIFLGYGDGSRVIEFGLLILNLYIVGMLLLIETQCFTREHNLMLQVKKGMSAKWCSRDSKQEPRGWFNSTMSRGFTWVRHTTSLTPRTTI